MNKEIRMFRNSLLLLLLLIPAIVNSQNIDIRILRSINSQSNLRSDNFFRLVSNSDAYMIGIIPAGVLTAGLVQKDKKMLRNGLTMVAAGVVNFGITTVLKYSINRDRPFVTYPDLMKKSAAGSPSFPSGHTSSAFAMATSVSLTYPKWYIIAPSCLYAGAVGYSRMYLGVHYPSDVLAGAVIGAGSAWLTYEIGRKLNKHPKRKACDCP